MTRTLLKTPRFATLLALGALSLTLVACSSPGYDSSDDSNNDSNVTDTDTDTDAANSDGDAGSGEAPAEPEPEAPAPASGGDSVEASAIIGVWSASDGSGTKVIDGSGQCSGMYWNNGSPLDIGGPMRCALGSQQASDGSYTLVVQQPPNQASYPVTFHGNSFTLVSGGVSIVLTRQ